MHPAHHGSVLVGLGDPGSSAPALEWAAREASARHRTLHVVRAYEWSPGVARWATDVDRVLHVDLRRASEAEVRRAALHVGGHRPDVEVVGSAIEGCAWDVLIAESRAAAMCMVGTRHLGVVSAAVLGSVTSVVVARASGTVVVIADAEPVGTVDGTAVVVGVDGSADAHDVLAFAFDHAGTHGHVLRAVLCRDPHTLGSMQWGPEQPTQERAERWLAESLAGWQEKYPDVQVVRIIVEGHPISHLVEASAGQDLLVVGAHDRHPRLSALLGSTSQGVLRHARCPVAVVHAP